MAMDAFHRENQDEASLGGGDVDGDGLGTHP